MRPKGGAEDQLIDLYERVLDQGLEIVILCHYGRRDDPAEAHLMQWNFRFVRESIAVVPIPVNVRDDVKMPRVWPSYPECWFGIH